MVAASFACRKMASKDVDSKAPNQGKGGFGSKVRGCCTYLYNSDEGTILGRTGISWAKLGFFYLIYYGCLAGFFAICLLGFFQTLDIRTPTQIGMNSLIKGNPGMGFRPQVDVERTLIRFEQGKEDNFKQFTKDLEAIIKEFNETEQANGVDCEGLSMDDKEEEDVCKFNAKMLGDECTADKKYGYYEGMPCVLIKMNKVFNWKPEPFENVTDLIEEMEERGAPTFGVEQNFVPGKVFINCQGLNTADQDTMGPVEYYPKGGISSAYYPFTNQDGYLAPVIMARFTKPRVGTLIQVWCKAWAKNIYHHKNDRAGSVKFELLVD